MLHARLLPYIELAKRYEDSEAQAKARQLIPLSQLMKCAQQKAMDIIEDLQAQTTAAPGEKLPEKASLLKHCLLLELLKWFKTEFFKWFDRENCRACDNLGCEPVQHATLCIPTVEDRRFGGNSIEVYQCPQCRQHYRFPRYNDPLKLLETRRGRCGEWANAFTLCCRACGFDARFVLDFTDHVWTEVWSDLEGRWLHCDPCENVCDKPLLYEAGWGKKLSYVFAFSRDELVDVTWRYTSKPLVLKRRRNLMDESNLVQQVQQLNSSYFTPSVSPQRLNLALQRRVCEVVEFLNCTSRTASRAEQHGRSSGSLTWRLGRGETSTAKNSSSGKKFVFKVDEETTIAADAVTVRIEYDVISNKYAVYHNDRLSCSFDQWANCVYSGNNIERKEEHDWNMVYLSRCDGSGATLDGYIEWRFKLKSDMKIGKVTVRAFNTACYETGAVKWYVGVLEDDKELKRIAIDSNALQSGFDCTSLVTESLAAAGTETLTTLRVSAALSGGQGNIGWQQTQLFRSSTKKNTNEQQENSAKAQLIVTFQLERLPSS